MIETKLELKIKEIVGIAVGEASLQWTPTPTGVFDSAHASAIVDRVTCDILNIVNKRNNDNKTIVVSKSIAHLVPDVLKNLEDVSYRLTKIEAFNPQSQVAVGDALTGCLTITERNGLPCIKVICERSFKRYIRTSPVVTAWRVTEDRVEFKTEGGIYELERLD